MIVNGQEANFKADCEVAGCYIEHNWEFLFLQKNNHKYYRDSWGVPAGKINPGEDVLSGLRREIQEETGIVLVQDPTFLARFQVKHSQISFNYNAYWYKCLSRPEVTLSSEHQAFEWIKHNNVLRTKLIEDEEIVFMRLMIFKFNGSR